MKMGRKFRQLLLQIYVIKNLEIIIIPINRISREKCVKFVKLLSQLEVLTALNVETV